MSTPTPKDTIITTLTDLGLGQNEANLYEILVSTPDATIPILQKKSPFSRTMLYYILQSLEQYELVEAKQVGKKTVYNAVAPERLEGFISEQEKTLHRQRDQLKSIIGDLRSAYNLAHNKPGVRFFEGVEGIKQIYLDTLNFPNSTIHALLSPAVIHLELKRWLDTSYIKERVKKNIEALVIAPNSPETNEYHRRDAESKRTTIIVDGKNFPVDMEVNIYGEHRLAFMSFGRNEMIGVIIESRAIFTSMKTFFQLAWLQAKGFGGEKNHTTNPTSNQPSGPVPEPPLPAPPASS